MSYFGADDKPDYWTPDAGGEFLAGIEPGGLIPDTATEIRFHWGDSFGRLGFNAYPPPGRTPEGAQADARVWLVVDAFYIEAAVADPTSTDFWYWNEVDGWHRVAASEPEPHRYAGFAPTDIPAGRSISWIAVTFIKPGLAIHGTADWPYPEPGTIRASLASGGSRHVHRRVLGGDSEIQPFTIPAGSDSHSAAAS